MATLSATINGYVASREWDAATLSPLAFWEQHLGHFELTEITPEQVGDALVTLAERGKLKPSRKGTTQSGKPYKRFCS